MTLSRTTAAAALVLAACSWTPPPPPTLELPAGTAEAEDLATWWQRFGDPQLDAIVARVVADNADLDAAAARALEAAALVRNADSLLPQADLSLNASRDQTSDRNAFPRFAGIDRRNSAHSISLDVAWELDLWGRIRKGEQAATAELLQRRELWHDLRAALAAQAAQTYFRLVAIDHRVALTEATLQNRRDALRIQQRRLEGGTGTALDVHQAEAEAEGTAAALPLLVAARDRTARALLVLAGATPTAIAAGELPRAAALPTPPPVPAGLPSDLLARRADVRAAEAGLAAASARVAEARTRWFPTISLTGRFGQESESLVDLLTSPATVWKFAGELLQPVFGTRKIGAQVDAAESRRLQAEAAYVQSVRGAFAEAHDALGARAANAQALDSQGRREAALQAAERIARARHDAGAGSFLELLDVQRNLFLVQQQQIDTRTDLLVATVDVYRALGGGWDPNGGPASDVEAKPPVPPAPPQGGGS